MPPTRVTLNHTPIEQEIIVLSAVWETLEHLVNNNMLSMSHVQGNFYQAQISSEEHKDLFLIRLVDFLSLPNDYLGLPRIDTNGSAAERSLLKFLTKVCDAPLLGQETVALATAVQELQKWLDEKITIPNVWLPSIDLETDIHIERIKLIKLSGNFKKHNFSRLNDMVNLAEQLLPASNENDDFIKAFLALPELATWFSEYFNRWETMLAVKLNDIIWGIFFYLKSEYERSREKVGRAYKFHYPNGCTGTLPKALYWNLMNEMTRGPIIPIFRCPTFLITT